MNICHQRYIVATEMERDMINSHIKNEIRISENAHNNSDLLFLDKCVFYLKTCICLSLPLNCDPNKICSLVCYSHYLPKT